MSTVNDDSAPHTPKKKNAKNAPPVWSRRTWTGGGTIEVAIYMHTVPGGTNKVVSYTTAVKRVWNVGEESRESRSFRPEDLLPLGRLLGRAFDFISRRQS